ncbi:MAG: hypothetical protein ABSF11_14930 [Methylocella sp.]|jgi:hypothetical protein
MKKQQAKYANPENYFPEQNLSVGAVAVRGDVGKTLGHENRGVV